MSTDFRREVSFAATMEKAATREELIALLQGLSGRALRTRAEIDAYLAEATAKDRAHVRRRAAWRSAKNALLAIALAMAFLQYYFLDVYAQIAALPRVPLIASSSSR